ncbi:hypothetical protein GAYE_SCF04G2454 [Galdieria yellowstonensis]|uniref:Myb domain-containing protein n=1 Tax=Galdieria yellowstonensis TaxID=3028027 RepID=A0AAV9IB29_9RHOD|nr:hypothetical protein GAYE_SCF04G2454 [Galdieria yellowstonensis]
MEDSLENASSEDSETRAFLRGSKELSRPQPVPHNFPPKNDKISPVQPLTQTAAVSTVVTTVSPSFTGLPVGEQAASILSGNTLQTTVVTTVGNASVASVANNGATVSVAAASEQRQPVEAIATPSTSAVQDTLVQTLEEPIISGSSKDLSQTNVTSRTTNEAEVDSFERENQKLREMVYSITYKRDKLRRLSDKLEKEIERQLGLINKYRSFLISTFESRPTYAFQHIIEAMRKTSSSSEYLDVYNMNAPEKRPQQTPSVSHNMKVTASAKASAMASTVPTKSFSEGNAKAQVRGSQGQDVGTSSTPYLEGSSTNDAFRGTSPDRKDKVNEGKHFAGNEQNWQSGGGKGRTSNLWTPEEDALFVKAFKQYGTKWKRIQKVLPNKSRQQIQSHGAYLLRLGKLNKELIRGPNKQVKSWNDDEQECNEDSKKLINTYNEN